MLPTFLPVFQPSTVNTSPTPWIKTHHITASVITPYKQNNFNSQDFNNFGFHGSVHHVDCSK
jgi:hypothetical protein